MSGPYDSVIGVEKEQILQRFLTGMPDVLRRPRVIPGSAQWLSIAMKAMDAHTPSKGLCLASKNQGDLKMTLKRGSLVAAL